MTEGGEATTRFDLHECHTATTLCRKDSDRSRYYDPTKAHTPVCCHTRTNGNLLPLYCLQGALAPVDVVAAWPWHHTA